MLKKTLYLSLFLFLFLSVAKVYAVSPTTTYSLSGSITVSSSTGTVFFVLSATNGTITGSNEASGYINYINGSFGGNITINTATGSEIISGSGDTISYNGNSITYDATTNSFSNSFSIPISETLTQPATCSDGSTPANGSCSGGAFLTCVTHGYTLSGSTCSETVTNSFTLSGSGSSINISGGNSSGSISMIQTQDCPTGYDLISGSCVAASNPGGTSTFECTPDGVNYQQCSAGTTLSGTSLTCTNNSVSATCQSGYTLNTSSGACTATTTLSQAPTCPVGTAYNLNDGQCEAPVSIICPSGTTYLTNGLCGVQATCPSGTTINTSGQCVQGGAITSTSCPSGTTYNSTNNDCEVSATCPTGYTLSGGQCTETLTQNPACPTGTTLSGTTCTASATCPTGYTLSSGQCTASPTCPTGSTVSGSSCTETTTSNPSLSGGGSSSGFSNGGYNMLNCWNGTSYISGCAHQYGSSLISVSASGNTLTFGIYGPTTPESFETVTASGGVTFSGSGLTSNTFPESVYGATITGVAVTAPNTLTFYYGIYNSTFTTGSFNITVSGATVSALNPDKGTGVVGSEAIGIYLNNIGSGASVLGVNTSGDQLNFPIGYVANALSSPSLATFTTSIVFSGGTSTTTVSPVCPNGTTVSSLTDTCTVAATCPSGTTYNSTNNDCEVSATCPTGYTLSSGQCTETLTQNPACPTGTTYNSAENMCSAQLSCPSGTTDISSTQCQGASSTTQAECPSGTTWNNQYIECTVVGSQNDACPTGTTVSGDMCVASASCPSGYTIDASNGLCTETITSTEPPSCPSGYSYLGGGTCSQSSSSNSGTSAELCPYQETLCNAVDTTPTCSGSGYTYNSATQQCEKTVTTTTAPTCASGATLDTATGQCVLTSGPSCPPGTTANGSYCDYTGNVMCPWNTTGNVEVYPINNSSGGVSGAVYGFGINWNQTSNECYYPDSNPSIVELYELAVQRLPDANGYDHWYSLWGAGQPSLSEVETWVTDAQTSYADGVDPVAVCSSAGLPYYPPSNTNAMNIIAYFLYYLGRCPVPSGYQYYLTNGYSSSNFLNSPECATDAANGTPCPRLGDTNMCTANYSYNSQSEDCESSPTIDCFAGGTQLSGTKDTCQTIPTCPGGYTLNSSGQCVGQPTTCSSGSLQNGKCISSTTKTECPTCPTGSTLQGNQCVGESCPLNGTPQGQAPGQNYTCVEPSGSSNYYCSPYLCYNNTTNTPQPTHETMPAPQTNNGTVTSSGCSGSIYIFPGQALQCTRDFALGENCCSRGKFLVGSRNCSSNSQVIAEAIIYDNQYSPPVPVYSGSGDMNTAPITSCSASSIANGCGQQGESVYIGNYCSLKLPVVGTCLAHTYVFCKFQGLLATIIQAQGRAQLSGGPDAISWGSAQSPNCTGFTPTQFQELNFSNMNLTEYIDVIKNQALKSLNTAKITAQIKNTTTSIGNEVQMIETGTTP